MVATTLQTRTPTSPDKRLRKDVIDGAPAWRRTIQLVVMSVDLHRKLARATSWKLSSVLFESASSALPRLRAIWFAFFVAVVIEQGREPVVGILIHR